jgi:hypothetical protein
MASRMQAACTAPMGVALVMPSQPTTGEMRPAIMKVAAPSREAAVPAWEAWPARARTWTQGNMNPVPMM